MNKNVGNAYLYVSIIHAHPNKSWSEEICAKYKSAMEYLRKHADRFVLAEVEQDYHDMICMRWNN